MRIEGSVIVVTGASSGIGRATAVDLARRGARVVLLARRADALETVALECAAAAATGGRTLVVPTDVTDPDGVESAARVAVERFGRLDGWVNCAAVMMFGPLLDVPLADLRRVLEVNLLGYVHGARAALPRFVTQGAGVLVNVSSLLGRVAQPYGTSYTMSKFAIRGLGFALREELRAAGARGVAVSTVLPAGIDTPIYASAANHTGRVPRPPAPVYAPDRVARVIVGQLHRPRREVVAGGVLGRALVLQHLVAPRLAERVLALDVELSLRRDGAAPPTSGSLHTPGAAPAAVHGGWRGIRRERGRRTAALVAALVTAGAGAVAGAVTHLRRTAALRRAHPAHQP